MNEHFQVLSLKPYLDILYRHRLIAACTLVVGLGITLCLVTMLPDVYMSSAIVLIEPQEVAPAYVTTPAALNPSNRVRILSVEALSRARLEEVIRQLNLYPRERAGGEPMDEVADYMRRHISVNFGDPDDRDAQINSFKISFEYPAPSLAQSVTMRLADTYVDEDLNERTSEAVAASQFLQDQVTAARAKLQQKTSEIEAYKTSYAGSLPQDLDYNLEQLGQLEQQLATANREINDLSMNLNGTRHVSPEVRLKDMETRLATMRAQYTEQYPDIKALRAEIASLKKSLAASAGKGETGEQKQQEEGGAHIRARLDTQVNALRASIAQYRTRVAETPKHEEGLSTLQRDGQILAASYKQLLHKQLEAQTSARLEERQEAGRFRVLDPATLPVKPESPNRIGIALMGTALSLLAAIGLPFALYFTDTSFKQPDELSRECGLPVLATIPFVREAAASARRWTLVRAAGISCVALLLSAIWIYAIRIF